MVMQKKYGTEVCIPEVNFKIKEGTLDITFDVPFKEMGGFIEFEAPIYSEAMLQGFGAPREDDMWTVQLQKEGELYKFSVGGEYLGDIKEEEIIPSLRQVLII